MKKLIYDNKGLSLLEFVVAIAIASLIFTVIATLMSNSVFQYRKIGTDAGLQNEAQLTSNQIRDWLMEVNKGISWSEGVNSSKLYLYYVINEFEDGEEEMIGVLTFYPDDEKITYKLFNYGDSETDAEEYLLSDRISNFSCNVDKVFTDNIIEYSVTYFLDDEEWVKNNEFIFRNEIIVVDKADEIFGS